MQTEMVKRPRATSRLVGWIGEYNLCFVRKVNELGSRNFNVGALANPNPKFLPSVPEQPNLQHTGATFTIMLALAITAELNGYVNHYCIRLVYLTLCSVTDLQPEDAEATPFYYTFKVQCTSCREIHPNWVSVSRFVSLQPSLLRSGQNLHLRSP